MPDATVPEIWKPVLGREKTHQVSSFGRVRCLLPHPNPKKRDGWDGIKSQRPGPHGYPRVSIGRSNRFAHHIVADAFLGPRPRGLEVNHINGVKADNRAANLEYCTRSANCTHAVHILRSIMPGRLVLNPDLVRRIRSMAAAGVSVADIRDALDIERYNREYAVDAQGGEWA